MKEESESSPDSDEELMNKRIQEAEEKVEEAEAGLAKLTQQQKDKQNELDKTKEENTE